MTRKRSRTTRRTAASALRVARRMLIYALLIAGSLLYSVPFLWMLSTSLKEPGQVLRQPPTWIPKPFAWENYVTALTIVPFNQFIVNTCVITFSSVIGVSLSSSLAAYGFSRLRFPGRDFWFMALLGTMILPGEVTMIPLFMVFFRIGWVNTFKPIIVPAFFGSAFSIFLLRQFFMTIPSELDDAAIIDGCTPFGIYWRIMLPLSQPALATVAVFAFIYNWNDFWRPLIYLTSMEKYTIAVGLRMFMGYHYTSTHLMMAASTVALVPIITVFFLAQKFFVQGIALTGIKG